MRAERGDARGRSGDGRGGDGGRGTRSGAPRRRPGYRPRREKPDAPREAAYEVLRQVAASDAYANLVLPPLLRERGIVGRDAAFATELTYGTLRLRGRYDAVIARCTNGRPLDQLDPEVLDLLRLGTHQLLGMRVPTHAAVSETVSLARSVTGQGPSGLVNAVLRAVARRSPEQWLEEVGGSGDDVARLAATASHPEWIVRAFRQSLLANDRPAAELPDVLAANNLAPRVTLVARPGLVEPARLATEIENESGEPPARGRWSPYALLTVGGDPARLPSVRRAAAGVQDEGSQLVALALAAALLGPSASRLGPEDIESRGVDDGAPLRRDDAAPLGPHDAASASPDARWLDLCAGPGGKAALLGALAHERGAHLLANEVAPHRARLVRSSVAAVPAGTVEVRTGDGREIADAGQGPFDRVMVDAPCTGLGALRRRPESRWRRSLADLAQLGPLQRDLLDAALSATRVGGVVAYVTCSPHVAETRAVVEDTLRHRDDVELIDAVAVVSSLALEPPPGLGDGPFVQLWPHLHGTDAMFLALLRRTSS
ncbi:rRNA small subunit methyltransferase B [Georgenia subflava]|uniref:rRNA small subunit methyltransferase B n=1 Tax=Georgenia subflava TaxID=1622177 RepID=A0A6N7EMT6_9MICO|nr:transcription antitermination factor NusB [Georgenia subflava]MPV38187.1 rRNA small subunit methyltransferase B [Georgenia subflava]